MKFPWLFAILLGACAATQPTTPNGTGEATPPIKNDATRTNAQPTNAAPGNPPHPVSFPPGTDIK